MISTTPDKSASCALIGYNNLLVTSALAIEALTPNTYQRYLPGTGAIEAKFEFTAPGTQFDFVGIAAHNLGTHDNGVEITVSYAVSANGPTTEIATFTPSDNSAVFLTFDTLTAEQIVIETNAATTGLEIGVVSAGRFMRMEQPIYGGHNPIDLNQDTDYESTLSDTGQFLGRTVKRKGLKTTFSWQHLTPDWVRNTFKPFKESAVTTPFFIKWRPDLYEASAYCHTTSDIKPTNMGGGSGLMQLSMNVRAHSEL